MRYDRVLASFATHPEWYTFVKGVGYVPTDAAPPEAVEAMETYNSYGFPHAVQCDLQEFFEEVRADVERRKPCKESD